MKSHATKSAKPLPEAKVKTVQSQREKNWVERVGERVVELVRFPNPPRTDEIKEP